MMIRGLSECGSNGWQCRTNYFAIIRLKQSMRSCFPPHSTYQICVINKPLWDVNVWQNDMVEWGYRYVLSDNVTHSRVGRWVDMSHRLAHSWMNISICVCVCVCVLCWWRVGGERDKSVSPGAEMITTSPLYIRQESLGKPDWNTIQNKTMKANKRLRLFYSSK